MGTGTRLRLYAATGCTKIMLTFYLLGPLCLYYSFHGVTRGDPGAGYSVHIWSSTSHACPTLLFNTSKLESPIQLQQSKQSRSCATTTSSIDSQTSKSPHKQPISFLTDQININNRLRSHRRREPAPLVLRGILGKLPQKDPSLHLSFFLSSLDPRLCVSIREHQLDLFLLLTGYLRVNVGLIITAMTGKLAEKLPLTMSSLINTIPDNLYPEEDIPTSMNIFTNTESISHYSQMNTGKITYLLVLLRFAFWVKCDVRGRQQLSPGLKHLFALMAVALEGVFLFLNINILNISLG